MASFCPIKPLLMDGPKPNSMVYTLGLSFPSVGLGRKAGPTRLKSFHPDMAVGHGSEEEAAEPGLA